MGIHEALDRVRIEDGALALGARRVPIRSGSVQYFRLERGDFRPALEAAKSAGLTVIETYVPWGLHEDERGDFDFGEVRPEYDLGAFLDTAHELGLFVFLRPGPHVNAELAYFGLPARVVRDETCWARSPRESPVYLHVPPRMFPVPSFASRRFHEEAARWLEAVARVAAPRLYPRGPIVLVQVDNEPCLYFRNGAYEQDYGPEARLLFQQTLRERYPSLPALRAAHGAQYPTFEDIEPPQRFEAKPATLARHLDWAAFQESLISGAMRRFADTYRAVGLGGVPLVANLPIGELGLPIDWAALGEAVDLVGLDYYHRASGLEDVALRTQLLAGTSALPLAPELGVGCPPVFPPISGDDSLAVALTALAFGLRGFNLYMWADRDRWIGAPADARGALRPEAERWTRLVRALDALGHERLRRPVDVAVVLPIEYRRLSRVTQVLGPLGAQAFAVMTSDPTYGCREDELGLGDAIQTRWWEDVVEVVRALRARGIPFDLVPSEAGERLSAYQYLYTPSYALAGAERWDGLAAAADEGALVFYGPELPSVSDRGGSARFEAHPRFVRLDTRAEGFADTLAARLLDEHGVRAPYPITPSAALCVHHEDAEGPRCLFLINPTDAPLEASVAFGSPARLRDALSDDEAFEVHEALHARLEPRSARFFAFEEGPR